MFFNCVNAQNPCHLKLRKSLRVNLDGLFPGHNHLVERLAGRGVTDDASGRFNLSSALGVFIDIPGIDQNIAQL